MVALTTVENAEQKTLKSPGLSEQEENKFLTFLLGQDMFAIGILHIKEIIEYGNLTAVPMMPSFIRGVINLRGGVVPVIDLGSRFAKPEAVQTKRTCIVILEVRDAEADDGTTQDIGIIVDAVLEVLEIGAKDIEPPPSFGNHIRADFIAGMGKVSQGFVMILKVEKILSVDELAALTHTEPA